MALAVSRRTHFRSYLGTILRPGLRTYVPRSEFPSTFPETSRGVPSGTQAVHHRFSKERWLRGFGQENRSHLQRKQYWRPGKAGAPHGRLLLRAICLALQILWPQLPLHWHVATGGGSASQPAMCWPTPGEPHEGSVGAWPLEAAWELVAIGKENAASALEAAAPCGNVAVALSDGLSEISSPRRSCSALIATPAGNVSPHPSPSRQNWFHSGSASANRT